MDHRSSAGERTVADDAAPREASDRTAERPELAPVVLSLSGRSAPTLVLLLLITALGLGLRLYRIGSERLWIDEAFSIWLARRPVVEMVGWRALRRQGGGAGFLGLMMAIPFLGAWIVSQWRPILSARTLMWTSLSLYVAMASGVSWFWTRIRPARVRRKVTGAVIAALIAVNAGALGRYYATFQKEGWDQAAVLVAERAQWHDLVLFTDSWGKIPFDYYFARQYNHHPVPAVVEHGLPVDLFARGELEPEMTHQNLPRLRSLVADRPRVWLIYSHSWYTDPEGLVPQTLASSLDPVEWWSFEGVEVRLYEGG